MRFTPKTEAEIASAGLWPPGEYDFEVKNASEETSTSNNDMIKLTVKVHNNDGDTITVWDYLVHTEKSAYKVRHFSEATGLLTEYEAGELDADMCVFRTGRCKLIIKKDSTGNYPDKNAISDYVKAGAKAAAPATPRGTTKTQAQRQPVPAGDIDDEIPF